MYTSENKIGTANLTIAFSYLIISIALAAAGAIYEHFSFGVYSNFMIYAFAIPLVGGTLPFMLRSMRRAADVGWTWHAGIATLTIGSIVHGILAISGRPNSLTIIYLVAGIILLICAAISTIKEERGIKTNF